MPKYAHEEVLPYEGSGESKKKQVARMFDEIAGRYDFLNRFLSAGIDVSWRRKMLRLLTPLSPRLMLELGREKLKARQLTDVITLQNGDSEAINFPDHSFDAVTVAFGVRNFEDLDKGLREILRVLRPGGMLCVLEFSKPTLPGIEQLYHLYLGLVAPEIAKVVSRNREAYKYLNQSVRAFPEGKAFTAIMNETGFKETTCRRLSLGICSIYTGRKAS